MHDDLADRATLHGMTTSARERPRLALAGGGAGDGGGDGPFVMTPALRQAIALLRMSRLELIAEIRRELEAPIQRDHAAGVFGAPNPDEE